MGREQLKDAIRDFFDDAVTRNPEEAIEDVNEIKEFIDILIEAHIEGE